MKNQMPVFQAPAKDAKTLNVCARRPNWNACRWRDENTELSADGVHILCHTQNPRHNCVGLCRTPTTEKL